MTIPEKVVAFLRGGHPRAFLRRLHSSGVEPAQETRSCDRDSDPVALHWVPALTWELFVKETYRWTREASHSSTINFC
jgi:hypothetical protein